ncbi:hypothetical protein HMPREF0058_1139 [Actinomyces urogenitalis DSM 15434]|uniref:Uncharacterized protein n=1 Tax=Actinomyces urogenitalis DSM 15434 TaxID=525246 RepID=C0W5J5_9ACTO|nr:hypothetical protein HMPREF0058_1139 [Actinomyces urogenitalis DSM 15434]
MFAGAGAQKEDLHRVRVAGLGARTAKQVGPTHIECLDGPSPDASHGRGVRSRSRGDRRGVVASHDEISERYREEDGANQGHDAPDKQPRPRLAGSLRLSLSGKTVVSLDVGDIGDAEGGRGSVMRVSLEREKNGLGAGRSSYRPRALFTVFCHR